MKKKGGTRTKFPGRVYGLTVTCSTVWKHTVFSVLHLTNGPRDGYHIWYLASLSGVKPISVLCFIAVVTRLAQDLTILEM